ncbi:SHIK [Mytilus edulis]|uniref:Serine/threonine-protein kinase 40 n=1 Tax=Mytilus edulis TaxID=6550 RepID=A0A8S3SYF6_MYTED|nr:SHIK [Mytilus edulis]
MMKRSLGVSSLNQQSTSSKVQRLNPPSAEVRKAGPYLLGPRQGSSPVRSIVQCLARKDGTDKFYTIKDEALEDKESSPILSGQSVPRKRRRLCLVLDCLVHHDFSDENQELVNLQHYVIKEKKLSEKEAIIVFLDIVRVVESLHRKNLVHRDLKLGNMVLNKKTKRITITNFCLGKLLVSETDPLKDQRGSPAYISPDVLSGRFYNKLLNERLILLS